MLFYDPTLMASRFVNNYRGKTGILSITFATCEQYSQKLRDIYGTISDAQKLSTLWCRGNSPEWTDSTAASVVSRWLHHLFAQYEYTIWCKFKALCSKYSKISHVTWKIPLLVKHCSPTVMKGQRSEVWSMLQGLDHIFTVVKWWNSLWRVREGHPFTSWSILDLTHEGIVIRLMKWL
jgi:hypothetical protein